MSLNLSDKSQLRHQILPEIEFNILANGITIISNDRLSTPRFLPYDEGGRCKCCKATEVEIDYIVTKEGVTIYCTRFTNPRFVAFDSIYDLPGYCFFRVKNKGRVFNIPYGERQTACIQQRAQFNNQTSENGTTSSSATTAKQLIENLTAALDPFGNTISTAVQEAQQQQQKETK